jgi:hypothetical protein
LGSPPAIAVFTSGEVAMRRATAAAARGFAAPRTAIVTTWWTPSPSAISWVARSCSTSVNASPNAVSARPVSADPVAPDAITDSMSLVDVSPSTAIAL